jgi:hydrogenase-1 operon protein HyaF
MTGLDDIGIESVFFPDEGPDAAAAVLREIESLLQRLVESGETGTIDLRSLPLSPGGRAILEDTLGQGEVAATVTALGPSQIRETAIGGVWWVIHRNEDGEVAAEFIEVTLIPAILPTRPEDARDGLTKLRARLDTNQQEGGGDAG